MTTTTVKLHHCLMIPMGELSKRVIRRRERLYMMIEHHLPDTVINREIEILEMLEAKLAYRVAFLHKCIGLPLT